MPDKKITELTELAATPDNADIVAIVDDVAGTPITKKITIANLLAGAGGVPAGSMSLFGAASAPSGWLLCDGTAVSRTTYAALFAVISTNYGVGNGTTTFNVPDLKGRVPVGKSTDAEFDVLGETGGAKTHQLSVAELATHTHALARSSGGSVGDIGPAKGQVTVDTDFAAGTVKNTGSNTAHNNLQPYIVVNYIIKT